MASPLYMRFLQNLQILPWQYFPWYPTWQRHLYPDPSASGIQVAPFSQRLFSHGFWRLVTINNSKRAVYVNPCHTTGIFLDPLKTSGTSGGNRTRQSFQRAIERDQWHELDYINHLNLTKCKQSQKLCFNEIYIIFFIFLAKLKFKMIIIVT